MNYKPFCAKCNKPVDWVETFYNQALSCEVFKFHCHGETEIAELPKECLEDIGTVISLGALFSPGTGLLEGTKRLGSGPVPGYRAKIPTGVV